MIKHIIFLALLVSLPSSSTFGQTEKGKPVSFDELGKQWIEYEKKEVDNNLFKVSHRYFRDTVSVKEMRNAFFEYKDVPKQKRRLPYENFDVVEPEYRPDDKYVMVLSPLKNHPKKEVRECRSIWGGFFGENLTNLMDRYGNPQKKLLEELNGDKSRKWLDGEIMELNNPLWYMGFYVSPTVYFEAYNNGKRMANAPYANYSDFFAYAAYCPFLSNGSMKWWRHTGWGARLIGTLHTMNTGEHYGIQETSFSVLLYTKVDKNSLLVSYSLELLEPESPDEETKTLFEDLKSFVERIPSGAFAPYFTTDMRLMTGRYYKVTVNNCGWLIEDYLDIK